MIDPKDIAFFFWACVASAALAGSAVGAVLVWIF